MRPLLTSATLLLVLVTGAGREAQASAIYWTESGGAISDANADGTGRQTVVTGLKQPAGIALDLAGGMMYWADFGGGTAGELGDIRRASLNGTGQETLVSGMRPLGIALDIADGKMYWTTANSILRANLDGAEQQTLVSGLHLAASIALDVAGGKMYWTDTDFSGIAGQGYIGQANLDGSGQQMLVSGLDESRGIALDVAGGKMYWTDLPGSAGSGVIRQANLDGTGQQTLLSGQPFPAGIALDVAGGMMYWADVNRHAILGSNLDGSGLRTLIPQEDPFGIAFAEGIVVPTVPEPSNWVLLSTGLFALAIALRWSRGQDKS
jgi:DNA-binding beta-propeller fold protein YncE